MAWKPAWKHRLLRLGSLIVVSSLGITIVRRALLIITIVLVSLGIISYIGIEIVIGSYLLGLLVNLKKALFLYSLLIRIPDTLKVNHTLISPLANTSSNFNFLGSETNLAFLYTLKVLDS